MSSTERAGWFRRVDVRLGLTLAGIYAPLVAVVLFALYAFAATELLELAELEVQERLSQLESSLQEPVADDREAELELLGEQLMRDDGGFVVRDATGRMMSSGGRAAPPSSPAPDASVLRAIATTRDDFLHASKRTPTAQTLEVFLGSAAFVQERDEIQRGFWITLALGILLVAVASVPATRMALAPLRRATRTAEAMDVTDLSARLTIRNTRDDIDRHSEVVNKLLDRIESGFARIQAFSQDVAHELRTPVNRILNAAEIALLEASRGSANDRGELQSIRDSAEQMARIVDNLLLLARSEEGRLSLEREPIEIAELCETLREMYDPACEDLGIDLRVSADECTVLGDPTLLLRSLANLVDNAIAHTPPGGSIRISCSRDALARDWVAIEVADTGSGIPRGDRERIFDRFVRLPGARGGGGVGLGLAITRSLARAHGGDACVKDGSGPGTCFVVRVPAA